MKPSFWLNFTTLDWLMLQRVGELLRRVVAQQVRVLQQEVRNAALDRRHLVTLRADFEQRRHGIRQLSRCGSQAADLADAEAGRIA